MLVVVEKESIIVIRNCVALRNVHASNLDTETFQVSLVNFNCCFTVHFDKYKTILPTNALFIKT